MTDVPSARGRLIGPRVWHAYVLLWLVVWAVLVTRPGAWPLALAHWPIAVLMVLGSFVAGSMPIGGGAVAFPVLVLAMGQPPAMARDFALAIQSVGMTSALVFILSRQIPLARAFVGYAAAGAVLGLLAGTLLLSEHVPAASVKLAFATLWVGFAAALLPARARPGGHSALSTTAASDRSSVLIGAAGGVIAALIGTGVEVLVYATLVFRDRWAPKSAVPSAVAAMALAAPVGLALRMFTTGLHPGVRGAWLAAVPIVLFGAPAGAYASTIMSPRLLVRSLAVLSLLQFGATLVQVRPGPIEWLAILLALGGGAIVFRRLAHIEPRADREVSHAARGH